MIEHIFKNGIEYKKCSTCKELKVLQKYSNNKACKDGLKPYCKECAKAKGKVYRKKYYVDDLNRKKEWYKTTKNKSIIRTETELCKGDKICSKCLEEKLITHFRERANGGFYSICIQCENKYNKEYRKNNPENYKIHHTIAEQRRRHRTKLLITEFKKADWIKCKEYFNHECAYCGKPSKALTQDHFVPVTKGGHYTKNNIIPACRVCNSSKNNRDFIIWYKEHVHYSKKRKEKIKRYLNTFE